MFMKFGKRTEISLGQELSGIEDEESGGSSYNTSFNSESDDSSQGHHKARIKNNTKTGSYHFDKSNLFQDFQTEANDNFVNKESSSKLKAGGKLLAKKIGNHIMSQSYNLCDSQSEVRLLNIVKSYSTTGNYQNIDSGHDVEKLPAADNLKSEGISHYRKMADEASGWTTDNKNTTSSSDVGSAYDTSCSIPISGGVSPNATHPQNGGPQTNEDKSNKTPSTPLFVHKRGINLDEVMKTVEEFGDLQSASPSDPAVYRLPSVSTVTHLLSKEDNPIIQIISKDESNLQIQSTTDSGLGSGNDSVLTKSDSNISTIEMLEQNKHDTPTNELSSNLSRKLFNSCFDENAKSRVYIKSNKVRSNKNITAQKRMTKSHDNIKSKNDFNAIVKRIPKSNSSMEDISSIEGKNLKETSTNWILSKKSRENKVPVNRRKRQALTKMKESLGSLLPYNGARQLKKITEGNMTAKTHLKSGSSIPCPRHPMKSRNSKSPNRWFQRVNTDGKDDQINSQSLWTKQSRGNYPETKKEIDFFLRARYNGLDRKVVKSKCFKCDDELHIKQISDSQNEKYFIKETTAQIHFMDCEFEKSALQYQLGHDMSDFAKNSSESRKISVNFSNDALPKKGILKKCSSIESGDLISECSEKRKRNVVTYDLPHSDLSLQLEDEYDSIEVIDDKENSTKIKIPIDSNTLDEETYSKCSSDSKTIDENVEEQQHTDQMRRLRALTYEDVNVDRWNNDKFAINNTIKWNNNQPTFSVNTKNSDCQFNEKPRDICSNGKDNSIDISSISSKGSICSTKASFDCILPNRYKPLYTQETRFGTIDKFKSQLRNPQWNKNQILRESMEKRRHARFRSSIPIPARVNFSSKTYGIGFSSSSDSSTQNTIIRNTASQNISNKESQLEFSSTITLDTSDRTTHQTNSAGNVQTQEYEISSSISPSPNTTDTLEELDNYESYCLVEPVLAVIRSTAEQRNNQEDSSSEKEIIPCSFAPQRPMRRASVSTLIAYIFAGSLCISKINFALQSQFIIVRKYYLSK